MSEIRQLLLRLSSPDGDEAEAAFARLAVLGARAIEPLLDSYSRTPEVGRQRRLRLLERTPDRRAESLLLMVSRQGSSACRRLAVRALGALPSFRGAQEMWKLLDTEEDSRVRREIVSTLAQLAASSLPEMVDPVLDVLFDQRQEPGVRRASLPVLASLPPRAARRLLNRIAETSADPLREEALSILGGNSPETVPALASAMARGSGDTSPGSALRLMRMGLRAVPAILRTLERNAGHPAAARRCAQTLAGMGPEARRSLACRLKADWPPEVLDRALDAVAGLGDRQVLVALKRLAERLGERRADEPDPERAYVLARLQARAHRLIAAAGSRLAIADLKVALAAPGPIPPDLVAALNDIGRADDLVDLLPLHSRNDPWLRACVANVVRRIQAREGWRRTRRAAKALPPELALLLRQILPESRAQRSPRRRAHTGP
ncbi:MAG: hypothetical protein ACE5HD_09255 [Acidobacteriota bacterium]